MANAKQHHGTAKDAKVPGTRNPFPPTVLDPFIDAGARLQGLELGVMGDLG